jgi:hypothetical protein
MADGGRAAIDSALREDGEFGSLDELLRELGRPLGLRSAEELITLLKGEAAVALWPADESFDEPDGVLLAEVSDEKVARDVMERLFAAASRGRPRTEKAGDVTITTMTTREGEEAAFAVLDGYLVAGTPGGVRTYLDGGSKDLTATRAYADTRKTLGTPLGSFVYLDLRRLFESTSAGLFLPSSDALDVLEGAMLNFVTDRGLARASGVVAVKE